MSAPYPLSKKLFEGLKTSREVLLLLQCSYKNICPNNICPNPICSSDEVVGMLEAKSLFSKNTQKGYKLFSAILLGNGKKTLLKKPTIKIDLANWLLPFT